MSGGWWRWLAWLLLFGWWTFSLVTPHPVRAAHAVLPPEYHFAAAKTLHVSVYALLAGTLAWLPGPGWLRWAMVGVLSLHAGATEYAQTFVPGRTGSWRDVGLDHLGIALGLALTARRWRRARGRPGRT